MAAAADDGDPWARSALQVERKRAEALAEIDRAKTRSSNVSHSSARL